MYLLCGAVPFVAPPLRYGGEYAVEAGARFALIVPPSLLLEQEVSHLTSTRVRSAASSLCDRNVLSNAACCIEARVGQLLRQTGILGIALGSKRSPRACFAMHPSHDFRDRART